LAQVSSLRPSVSCSSASADMARALLPFVAALRVAGVSADDGSVVSTTAQPTCPEFEAELVDIDLSGELLNSVWMEESATIDDCCSLCEETEGCKGFVYYWQTCYLKGGTIGTFNNTGRISRVMRPQPQCQDFEGDVADTDLTGELLRSVWMHEHSTIDDCCTQCDETEGCMGFVYYWQTCHLKGGTIGTFNNTGRISRVRRVEPKCSDFEAEANNTDLGGELLSSVWMDGDATIDDCCPLCDDTEGCMGFVYYEQTCHLKGGSSLSTYENAGRISRVRSPCSGFEPTELGKDLAGDMLYDFVAQLPEACCGACAQNQDCQGFAFAGERCYLKTNVSGTFSNPGCVAGLKDGVPARRLGGSMMLV